MSAEGKLCALNTGALYRCPARARSLGTTISRISFQQVQLPPMGSGEAKPLLLSRPRREGQEEGKEVLGGLNMAVGHGAERFQMELNPGTLPHPVSSGKASKGLHRERTDEVCVTKEIFESPAWGRGEGRVSKGSPTLGVGRGGVDSHIRSTPEHTADFRLQARYLKESDPSRPPERWADA